MAKRYDATDIIIDIIKIALITIIAFVVVGTLISLL